jgi:hypothetical protein
MKSTMKQILTLALLLASFAAAPTIRGALRHLTRRLFPAHEHPEMTHLIC